MNPTLRLTVPLMLLLAACQNQTTWNSPYPKAWLNQNIYFSAFSAAPKTLDPARAYSSDSLLFLSQIIEPPLQYDYFSTDAKRTVLAAKTLPTVTFYDAHHHPLPHATQRPIAYSVYDIYLRSDLQYAPHPALALNDHGTPIYRPWQGHSLPYTLREFKHQGTRYATAADFIYQLKRLGSPKVNAPIAALLAKHLQGFKTFERHLQHYLKQHPATARKDVFLDLRKIPLSGVKYISKHHYQIILNGHYPAFLYWLTLPFFGPTPWEVDAFYAQSGFSAHNLDWNWQPIGTGPYQLTENNPNQRMVLSKNPHFHLEIFPTPPQGFESFKPYAGRKLPMIDTILFSLDKESIPRWHKFLQGYYDRSSISSDHFSSAITLDTHGRPMLTPQLKQQHLTLQTSVNPDVFYLGFNMKDPIVGGHSETARTLRHAISIALNYQNYIQLFMNGRGTLAHSPIPPMIWGSHQGQNGINTHVFTWQHNQPVQRSLKEARALLAQAGYPRGIDPATGHPLILNYDVVISGGPDDAARLNWMRMQFKQLGIDLHLRGTDYNRFQSKASTGNLQIFSWGWSADYPDPENFLGLLYGPHGQVAHYGPNTANYNNPAYDRLFERMQILPNGPERQHIIDAMIKILQKDAPWVWGVHSKTLTLSHAWVGPTHPNTFANNTLKYLSINPKQRARSLAQWNQIHPFKAGWPLMLFVLALCATAWHYRRKQFECATPTYPIIPK